MKRDCVSLALLMLFAVAAAPARAQDEPPDPSQSARVRLGPLALSPALALTNAGVDNNVFNDPTDASPKSDFTMTLEPRTDLWLHIGRSMLTGTIVEDLVYYQKNTNQRSANNADRVGLLVPLTRITLAGNVGYVNAKDRPGFEIDARVQHIDISYDGSVELRALSKTFIGVKAIHTHVTYDQTAAFDGANLENELNRTSDEVDVTLRHQLTPLTSLTFDAGQRQDRFEFDHLRDSDSTVINGGVKFDPFALLKGSARFGYRDFKPLIGGVPGYQGATAAVDLSYVANGSTKLTVGVTRDILYSYDVNQPYYVQTAVQFSIAQQIFGPVDVVGRVGLENLDYRDRTGAAVLVPNRTDVLHSYGGGVGYHLGGDVRIGFNIDQYNRTSDIAAKKYDDLRYGAAVTYGF